MQTRQPISPILPPIIKPSEPQTENNATQPTSVALGRRRLDSPLVFLFAGPMPLPVAHRRARPAKRRRRPSFGGANTRLGALASKSQPSPVELLTSGQSLDCAPAAWRR